MPYSHEERMLKTIKNTLVLGGYIKGYGKGRYRLMDVNHNPIMNFGNEYFSQVSYKLVQDGLVYIYSNNQNQTT